MWITALVIGFAGSMHCLGMCSPLLMAVTAMKPSAIWNRILYNGGRLMSYGALGAIVAAVGIVIPFHKYQNIVSIALGLTLLGIAFGGITKVEIPVLQKSARALTGVLKNLFSIQLAKKNRFSVVILGALNGLLPCGLTLIALTWCITLKGPLDGFYFMLIFGAGTLPVMLGLTGIIPWLLSKFKLSITMFTTAMLILSGCLLIARVFMIHVPHTSASESGIMEVILCR